MLSRKGGDGTLNSAGKTIIRYSHHRSQNDQFLGTKEPKSVMDRDAYASVFPAVLVITAKEQSQPRSHQQIMNKENAICQA